MKLTMNDDSIFIGIDPGSNKLGFAIIANYFGKVRLVKSGVIVFHKNDSLQKKLLYVFNYFNEVALGYFKDGNTVFFSLERQYCDKNPQSAFILVAFYSIFLLLAEQYKNECIVMTPCQIKKLISGSGKSSKEELLFFLRKQFNLYLIVSTLDESDAIAIALCAVLLKNGDRSLSDI